MSLRFLLFGLIAVSAFVILGIFLQSLLTVKPADQPVAVANQILVAAENLPRGRLLRPEDVKWKSANELPAAAVAAALATQPGGGPTQVDAKALGDNVGAITRRNLAADEALLTTDVVRPGDRDFLPAVLAPGARAVTVSVSTLSGSSAGLIYPGDHVDLLLTQKFNEPNLPIGRRTVGEDIAQNLRVLAIDHYTQGGTIANNNEPQLRNAARTVTLEADPTVAVKIEVASDLGKLSLILRSLDTAEIPKTENPEVWAVDTSSALQQLSKYAPLPEAPKPLPPPTPPHIVMVYRGDAAATNTVNDLPAPPTAVKN
jgi:pilus assembly protein CpaB